MLGFFPDSLARFIQVHTGIQSTILLLCTEYNYTVQASFCCAIVVLPGRALSGGLNTPKAAIEAGDLSIPLCIIAINHNSFFMPE